MNWEPSEKDIAWTRNLIGSLKIGGTWAVPVNKSIWTFWHDSKKAILQLGDENEETNKRIAIVLRDCLGWAVSIRS
jgi:hypothetical protein